MTRVVLGVWFAVLALLFTLLSLPRQGLARYYLWQLQQRTGLTVAYDASQSQFGLRSADLHGVKIGSGGSDMLDLDSLDWTFGLLGVDYSAHRQDGSLSGRWTPRHLTFEGRNFPLPDIAGDWISHMTITPTGDILLPDKSGSGTLAVQATAGKNLTAFGVHGTLQGSGDYRLDHGNLSFQTALTGDQVNGRLDFSAAQANGSYVLGGTLDVEVNGNRTTLDISGTPAHPGLSPARLPGGTFPSLHTPTRLHLDGDGAQPRRTFVR